MPPLSTRHLYWEDRTRTLFIRHKRVIGLADKVLGSIRKLAPIAEPIVFLIRRSNRVEFYERVTVGEWEIEHSDKRSRTIHINPAFQVTFDYGSWTFRGYICHEDSAYPITHNNPLLETEQLKITIDKLLADVKNYKAEEIHAKTGMIIAIGAVVIIGIWVWYNVKSGQAETAQLTAQQCLNMIKNATLTDPTLLVK